MSIFATHSGCFFSFLGAATRFEFGFLATREIQFAFATRSLSSSLVKRRVRESSLQRIPGFPISTPHSGGFLFWSRSSRFEFGFLALRESQFAFATRRSPSSLGRQRVCESSLQRIPGFPHIYHPFGWFFVLESLPDIRLSEHPVFPSDFQPFRFAFCFIQMLHFLGQSRTPVPTSHPLPLYKHGGCEFSQPPFCFRRNRR